MKKSITCFMMCFILIVSCKKRKQLPETEITDPHFYVSCNMDGAPLYIAAGNEDYYMNSSWLYSDTNSLYVYTGNLAKETGTGYQVTFLINNYKATSAYDVMHADSALKIGEHLYNDKNEEGLIQTVRFKPVKAFPQSKAYSWVVTDGVTSLEYSEYSAISPILNLGKTYSVSMRYNDGRGVCETSHQNVFKVGNKIQTTVKAIRDVNSHIYRYQLSYSTPDYPGNYRCLWQFEDNSISEEKEVVKIFEEGTSIVKLLLTDIATGDSCISYYQINATSLSDGCDPNFVAEFFPIQNTRLFSSVSVLVTDPNGRVYSSEQLIQPQQSKFEIVSVSDYRSNTNGEQTKRVKIKFNCLVKNGTETIHLTNGEAVIAVAYK